MVDMQERGKSLPGIWALPDPKKEETPKAVRRKLKNLDDEESTRRKEIQSLKGGDSILEHLVKQ